jgi:hypothetical protein
MAVWRPRNSQPPPPSVASPVVLELPRAARELEPVHGVRGTVLLSSMFALRELGLFDDYRKRLADAAASDVLGVMAGAWAPLETAFAHYRACEAIGLNPSTQLEIGKIAGKRACGAMLGTAVRFSRFAGATPWTLMRGGDRIWKRAYDGGGMRILRVGDRDALVETYKNPLLLELAFCRNSFRGFCVALYGLVSDQISMREARVTRDQVDFRATWK